MRMWGVNPKYMCNQHLLGEHVEMHMFIGTIRRGKNIDGYIKNKLVNPCLIKERHNELVKEMIKRGMNHKSPMNDYEIIFCLNVPIDVKANEQELKKRCKNCFKGKHK